MPGSQATVETSNASKYLQQLCKHFAHKVEVEYDTTRAKVDFPFGKCHMRANANELTIECVADSPEGLKRAQFVVDDHLTRFAWREKPSILWMQRP